MKILTFKEMTKATENDSERVWAVLKVIRKMKKTFLKVRDENITILSWHLA